MPKCYFLTLCGGSSLDQHSNNVSLFNVVEQVNLQPNVEPPPGAYLPLEVHAYFLLGPGEISRAVASIKSVTIKGVARGTFETGDRFAIVAEQIGSVSIGGAKLALKTCAGNDLAALACAIVVFLVRGARGLVRRRLLGSGWRRQLKIGFRISVVAY